MSRANSLGRMERMRDIALALVGDGADGGPKDFAIDDVVEADDTMCDPGNRLEKGKDASKDGYTKGWGIRRTVWGHFSAPNFLEKPGPGIHTFLARSQDPTARIGGRPGPVQNGEARVNFVVRVPCSLADGTGRAKLAMQYGHGLFGSRNEVTDGYLSAMANRYQWILFATDWNGMSQYDVLNALRVFLLEASEFASVPERTMQGFVDKVVMLRLLRGRLATHTRAKLVDTAGNALLGPDTPAGYYGNSQGSVVGGGYFGFNPDLRRGVLGVPGCPFALLLSRSKDFVPYHAIIKLQMWSERDVRLLISVMQTLWDPAETAGWLTDIAADPNKHALLQAALGDAQVTPVAGEFMARSLGARAVWPAARPVFGVPPRCALTPRLARGACGADVAPFAAPRAGAARASAFVEYIYEDVPPAERAWGNSDVPPPNHDTHECPRRERRGQDQIWSFLTNGTVVQYCVNGTHPTEQDPGTKYAGGATACSSAHCPGGRSDNR